MESKALRGKIVAFLQYMSPKKVDTLGIVGVYIDYYTMDKIEKAIAYLVNKGYVVGESTVHPYKEREQVMMYSISASGVDLQEGTIQDAGVIVGRY